MIRLGILGCGNIGKFVIRNLGRKELARFKLELIADLPERTDLLKAISLEHSCGYTTDPNTLPGRGLDVLLEAATPEAVRKYIPAILSSGTDVLAMSVGAFADEQVLKEAVEAAESGGSKLLLPTGAIAGLDYLKAAQLIGLEEAHITITKAPKSLMGAPYFERHPTDLSALAKPKLVFQGTAAEAIQGFPANVNVAVALSLASIGPQKTEVRIVCEPAATQTKIEIFARGRTGELKVELMNYVSPENPKTSYQACASALATLRRFSDSFQIGS
jgi:aspartate dehydrogenase